VNGEGSVNIDRGHWLYRFVLDTENIAIYRSRRVGQGLVPADAWRCLAVLGVSDVFIVPVGDGWQPFVELGEDRQRWALERRWSMSEAETAASHFLLSLADAVAHAAQPRGALGDRDVEALRAPDPPEAPAEPPAVEALLARARAAREASGWELLYSRQRTSR
jgi:hypothetical protein